MRWRLAVVGLNVLLLSACGSPERPPGQRLEPVLMASDINALAEAIGCPQRGVSGDLVKPLVEQLTACVKAQRLKRTDPLRFWLPGQVLDTLGVVEHTAAHLDIPLSPAQFKELKAILCAAAFDWKHPRPPACESPGARALPPPAIQPAAMNQETAADEVLARQLWGAAPEVLYPAFIYREPWEDIHPGITRPWRRLVTTLRHLGWTPPAPGCRPSDGNWNIMICETPAEAR